MDRATQGPRKPYQTQRQVPEMTTALTVYLNFYVSG